MHPPDDPRPESAAERRERAVLTTMAETGIDDATIERLVRAFYDRARQDALLGPFFEEHVKDWPAHIAQLCDFWSSVALGTGRYHGSPMQAHMPMPLGREEFSRWLGLFRETATDVCPPKAAAHFVERADRIASSLLMGIAASRGEIVPPLMRT